MIISSVLVLFCLISACTTYGLGLFVYSKNPSSPSNRLFLIVMLLSTYWACGEYLIWNSAGYYGALFWLKASSFWTIVIAATVHFILAFTNHPLAAREKLPLVCALLYLPSVCFALIEIFTDQVFVIKYQDSVGFYYAPVQTSPVYLGEAFFYLVIMIWSAYLGYKSWIRAERDKIRRQNASVCIGMILVIGLGSQSVIILPKLGIFCPNLVFIGIVIFSLLITYAIQKYGLFTLGPETAAANIIRIMPEGLILTDMEGRITFANSSAEKIFREDSKFGFGQRLCGILPPDTCNLIFSRIAETGRFADLEVTRDTQERTVLSIEGSTVKDPQGEEAGVILIVRDITSRKEQEVALQNANEKISQLNRLTRHDISNQITSLSGYLDLMNEGPSSCREYLPFCIDIIQNMKSHLDFSSKYQQVGRHKPIWQLLPAMLQEATGALSYKGIKLTIVVDEIEIYSDPLIVKVFYNLFENAVRHGEKVTRITCSGRQDHAEYQISFTDDGCGVQEKEKEKIFLHGYGKNTGLGLTLIREILSVTGISIRECGIYGDGACFEVRIPAGFWRFHTDSHNPG